MPTDTMNVADEGQTLKCDCCDAALVDWSLAIVAEKRNPLSDVLGSLNNVQF